MASYDTSQGSCMESARRESGLTRAVCMGLVHCESGPTCAAHCCLEGRRASGPRPRPAGGACAGCSLILILQGMRTPPLKQSLALLLVIAAPALAAEGSGQEGVEGRVEELFLGEEAPPNQRHEVEAGSGLDWEEDDGEASFELPLHIEYGVTDALQIQGNVDLSPEGEEPTLQEGSVGARMALLNDGDRGLVVSAGAMVMALRDSPEESMRPGVAPFVLAYKDLGPVGLNASAGVELLPSSDGRDGTVHPNLGLAAVLGDGLLRPKAEAAFRNEQGTNTGILAPGLYVRPAESVEVGVSVPWRLQSGGESSLGVSALLTWSGGGSN